MGHVARMGERRGRLHTGFWWGSTRESDNLGDTGVDGRIILRWIYRKCDGGGCTDWIDLAKIGTGWGGGKLVNSVMQEIS